mmetsp:Transcript_10546/g.23231  ORF Transcript_10546/g.23231 Transcript_10546/m.23231 type:complete len:356 (+) Transcript_10546:1516-2583(+)
MLNLQDKEVGASLWVCKQRLVGLVYPLKSLHSLLPLVLWHLVWVHFPGHFSVRFCDGRLVATSGYIKNQMWVFFFSIPAVVDRLLCGVYHPQHSINHTIITRGDVSHLGIAVRGVVGTRPHSSSWFYSAHESHAQSEAPVAHASSGFLDAGALRSQLRIPEGEFQTLGPKREIQGHMPICAWVSGHLRFPELVWDHGYAQVFTLPILDRNFDSPTIHPFDVAQHLRLDAFEFELPIFSAQERPALPYSDVVWIIATLTVVTQQIPMRSCILALLLHELKVARTIQSAYPQGVLLINFVDSYPVIPQLLDEAELTDDQVLPNFAETVTLVLFHSPPSLQLSGDRLVIKWTLVVGLC